MFEKTEKPVEPGCAQPRASNQRLSLPLNRGPQSEHLNSPNFSNISLANNLKNDKNSSSKWNQYDHFRQFNSASNRNRSSYRESYSQSQIQALREEWNKNDMTKSLSDAKNDESIPAYLIKSGKFYDNMFKRQTVLKLILASKNNEEQELAQIRDVSRDLGVHPFQISVWVTAIKVVFEVEQQMEKNKHMTNQEKQNMISSSILSIMKKNPKEKKYKLVKLVLQIFRHLDLPNPRPSAWMNRFVFNYQNQLREVDLSQYNLRAGSRNNDNNRRKRKSRKEISSNQERNQCNIVQNSSDEPSSRYYNHAQERYNSHFISEKIIEKKSRLSMPSQFRNFRELQYDKLVQNGKNFGLNKQNEYLNYLPSPFKAKIAEKIDEILNRVLFSAIEYHAQQFAIPSATIQRIHQSYGVIGHRKHMVNGQSKGNIKNFSLSDEKINQNLCNGDDLQDLSFLLAKNTISQDVMINEKKDNGIQKNKNFYDFISKELDEWMVEIKSVGLRKSESSEQPNFSLQNLLQLEKKCQLLMDNHGFQFNLKKDIDERWMGIYMRSRKLISNDCGIQLLSLEEQAPSKNKKNKNGVHLNVSLKAQKTWKKTWIYTENQIKEREELTE